MDHHHYRTGQFAHKASVTIRTLRFYDRQGLLCPAAHTESGYRLYTDADLLRLQQILALKFLGFSLEEIKHCLQVGPTTLRDTLAVQKAMMVEQRAHLDTVIQAITEAEGLLHGNGHDWEALIRVIRVIQMHHTDDWRQKYFSAEELKQMEELSKQSYSEEARQKLAEWGKNWTEADQQRATDQWNAVLGDLKRLVAAGQEPSSPAAQALAGQCLGLIHQFTRGDAEVGKGLGMMTAANMRGETPYPPFYSQEEGEFLHKAIALYQQQHSQQ